MGQIHTDSDDKELNVDDVGEVEDVVIDDGDENLDTGDESEKPLKSSKPKEKDEDVPDNISDKKPTAREAIKHALKKAKEEEKAAKVSDDTDTEDTGDKSSENKEVKTPKVADTTKTPITWSKEAKAKWNELPTEVQAAITKRENEVSEGFKKYGEGARRLEELDKILTPRATAIKQFGVSEAQTVDRLFQWMEALAHTDKSYAFNQWMALGKNFGLELPTNATAKPATQTQEETNSEEEIPAHLKGFIDNTSSEIKSLKTTIQQQQAQQVAREEAAAKEFLNNWSKDKPHFEKVRQVMFGLLNSGVIPLKNGSFDLDSAYDQAVYANPEIRALVTQEEAEKARQKADQEAKDKKLKALEKANAAKKAATLSNRAPSGTAQTTPNKKPNGKSPSAGDSIRAAIKEVRENSN